MTFLVRFIRLANGAMEDSIVLLENKDGQSPNRDLILARWSSNNCGMVVCVCINRVRHPSTVYANMFQIRK